MSEDIFKYDDKGRSIYHSDGNGYETWDEYNEDGSKSIHFKEGYGESEFLIEFDKNGHWVYYEDLITGEESGKKINKS